MHAWDDADKGEILNTLTSDEVPVEFRDLLRISPGFSEYCWGPDGTPVNVSKASDIVIVVGAFELDGSSASTAKPEAKNILKRVLNNAEPGITRGGLVTELKEGMGRLHKFVNTSDDRVGIKELSISESQLSSPSSTKPPTMSFRAGNEGS